MPKKILTAICVGFLAILTGCLGKLNGWVQEDNLDDLFNKFPLMLEDIERIDAKNLPVSYEYSVYSWMELVSTWEYEYQNDVDYNWLLRIGNEVAWKDLVNSEVRYGIINTTIDVTLDNWEKYSVTYSMNPNTLKYLSATLATPTWYILYEFKY